MDNEKRYVWARWGDDWEIAINVYDEDEGKFIWVLNGMHIINEPDEIGSVVTRDSQKASTSDEALPIADVVGRSEQLNCDHPPDRLLYKGDPKRFRCSKCGKEIAI